MRSVLCTVYCVLCTLQFLLLGLPGRSRLVVRRHHRPRARAEAGEAEAANTGTGNRNNQN